MSKTAYQRLKPQQRRFVDLIVRRIKSPTDAIREIRPKLKNPQCLASRWKALPEIRAALEEREAEAMDEAGITNAQILLDIAAIADFDLRKIVKPDGTPKKLHELDAETARILQSVTIDGEKLEFKVPNRLEAKKLLGQYRKLFTQKLDLDGRLTLEQLVGASQQAEEGA